MTTETELALRCFSTVSTRSILAPDERDSFTETLSEGGSVEEQEHQLRVGAVLCQGRRIILAVHHQRLHRLGFCALNGLEHAGVGESSLSVDTRGGRVQGGGLYVVAKPRTSRKVEWTGLD